MKDLSEWVATEILTVTVHWGAHDYITDCETITYTV